MKKIITLVLAVALIFTAFPITGISVYADDVSGKCGKNLTYTIKDGILTISGTGALTKSSGYKKYEDSIEAIKLEEGITSICKNAFEFFFTQPELTLPSSLKKIGDSAFEGTDLESVTIPAGVTKIGGLAFNCAGLKHIYYQGTEAQWKQIKMGTFAIPDYAQIHCLGASSADKNSGSSENKPSDSGITGSCGKNLKFTIIDGTLVISGTGALTDNAGFKEYIDLIDELEFKEGITSICDNAFSYFDVGSEVTLPASLKEVGNYAFVGTKVKSFAIPKSLTKIGDMAFWSLFLENVYYQGTKAQMEKINKGFNVFNINATVSCLADGAEIKASDIKKSENTDSSASKPSDSSESKPSDSSESKPSDSSESKPSDSSASKPSVSSENKPSDSSAGKTEKPAAKEEYVLKQGGPQGSMDGEMFCFGIAAEKALFVYNNGNVARYPLDVRPRNIVMKDGTAWFSVGNSVCSLNISTGERRILLAVLKTVESITYYNGAVYVTGENGSDNAVLYSIDPETGKNVKIYEVDGHIDSVSFRKNKIFISSLSFTKNKNVDESRLFVGAYNMSNGKMNTLLAIDGSGTPKSSGADYDEIWYDNYVVWLGMKAYDSDNIYVYFRIDNGYYEGPDNVEINYYKISLNEEKAIKIDASEDDFETNEYLDDPYRGVAICDCNESKGEDKYVYTPKIGWYSTSIKCNGEDIMLSGGRNLYVITYSDNAVVIGKVYFDSKYVNNILGGIVYLMNPDGSNVREIFRFGTAA